MNPKIEKVFMVVWFSVIFMVAGALFNTGIAFASLWFNGIQVITAGLTGYGLYHLIKGSKV